MLKIILLVLAIVATVIMTFAVDVTKRKPDISGGTSIVISPFPYSSE